MSKRKSKPQRYDLAIVSSRRNLRVSAHGVDALIRYISAQGYLKDVFHSRGEGWVELWGGPGQFAHAIFHEGPSTAVSPVFLEFGLRYGEQPMTLGYGTDDALYFFLEFRGVAFDSITDEFLQRVDDVLYARPEAFGRIHAGLRNRAEVVGPDPPKKSDKTDGRIGTRVEEF